MATALYVALDGTDRSSYALGAEVTLRTINQGHSTWTAVLDNNAQTFNGLYDSQDSVYIKMASVDILKGYIDEVHHVVDHAKSTWHHNLKVSGRDYSQDLSNLFLSYIWGSTEKGDVIIDEALAYANSEITYNAGAGAADTVGGYEPHEIFLIDCVKDIFDRVNYEAYVDTNKALQAEAIGTTASGITLTYSDLVRGLNYTEKSGVALRNQIFALGEFVTNTTADEITEATTGWTSNGTISASAVAPQEGAWAIRGTKGGGGPVGVWLTHDLDYALAETEGKFHFHMWGWATSGGGNVVLDDAYIRLRQSSGNYFQYDLDPNDIGPINWQEYDLDIGRDHESGFTRVAYPLWEGLTECYFYGYTVAETDVYIEVDGVGTHHMNYQGFSEDSTSKSAYRTRMELQQDNLVTTHAEALDLGASVLEKKKDPLEHITLTVDGNSCISGGAFKLWPSRTVVLNYPKLGISTETWRVQTVTLKCYPYTDLSGHGHDFIAELDCVPQTTKIDHLNYPSLRRPRNIQLNKEVYKRRAANKRSLP